MTDIALDKRAKFAAQLRNAANEMRAEDHNGWPVLCDIVADYLDASPSQVAPANPAQVTDAIRSIVEDALNSAIPEPWEVAEHATQRILAAIGAGSTEKLGRFGHHPDPAIDFEVEVESLQARLIDAKAGISKPGTESEKVPSVLEDIQRAMTFRVGGDPSAVRAKQMLREIEADAISAIGAGGQAVADEAECAVRFAAEVRRRNRVGDDDERASISKDSEHAAMMLVINAIQSCGGLSALSQPHPADELVVEALEWYAVQVAGCRKVTSEGNDARAALNNDGGKRALAALSAKEDR